jgi:hypothetical protein
MHFMNRRVLRLLFLLWLGWYLSGPLFEMVDTWDTPQEEMSDVIWSASGTLSLVAAGVCIGVFVFRQLRELCCHLASSRASAETVRLVRFEFLQVFPINLPALSLDLSRSLRI